MHDFEIKLKKAIDSQLSKKTPKLYVKIRPTESKFVIKLAKILKVDEETVVDMAIIDYIVRNKKINLLLKCSR